MTDALQVTPHPDAPPSDINDWLWSLDDDLERAAAAAAERDQASGSVVSWMPSIDTAALADKHLYQVKTIRGERAAVERHAAELHARIDAWLARRTSGLERREALHSAGLAAYLISTGRSSVDLVNGRLKVVRGRERVEVVDTDRFLAAAPEALVRIRREPDKGAILQHYRQTGEIVDGTDVVRGDDRVSVTTD